MRERNATLIESARGQVRDHLSSALFLFLPNICNAKCGFCYVSPRYAESGRLSDSTLLRVREFAASARACGFEEFRLTGGEPTLFTNLSELIDSVVDCGLRYTVLTNGLRLGESLALFRRRKPARVTVSLHSIKRNEEIFQVPVNGARVLKNVAELIRNGVPVTLSVVVGALTGDDVCATILRAVDQGVESVKLICVNEARFGQTVRESFSATVDRIRALGLRIEMRVTDLAEEDCLLHQRGFMSVMLPSFRWTDCCATVGVLEGRQIQDVSEFGVAQMVMETYDRSLAIEGLPCAASIGSCPISLVRVRSSIDGLESKLSRAGEMSVRE
jgi:pyruvate-formate lyase-activating enzyme